MALGVFFVTFFNSFRGLCLSWSLVAWWMAPLAPAVMIMNGVVCQPRFCISFSKLAYFVYFSIIFWWESIITVCKFNKLNSDCRIRLCWGRGEDVVGVV
jgi:hypothetical protein